MYSAYWCPRHEQKELFASRPVIAQVVECA